MALQDSGSIEGICSTCVQGPTCVRRIYARTPIWHCDEFDDAVNHERPEIPVRENTVGNDEDMPAPRAATSDRQPRPAEHRGLCANCEERETCKLPRPAGGVWHCEEYS